MVEAYSQDVELKEENVLPFLTNKISPKAFPNYLRNAHKKSFNGVTLYWDFKQSSETGFMIRKKAGSAVERNKTRRLFWGLWLNEKLTLPKTNGGLFLFHKAFKNSNDMAFILERLIQHIRS
jgi:ribonuclease P protein component